MRTEFAFKNSLILKIHERVISIIKSLMILRHQPLPSSHAMQSAVLEFTLSLEKPALLPSRQMVDRPPNRY